MSYESPVPTHASASNGSLVSKAKDPEVIDQPSFTQAFSNDKINQAFQNLFGRSTPDPAVMQTPSFQYDQRHQIKVKPYLADGDKPKLSSVFSPIPCKP